MHINSVKILEMDGYGFIVQKRLSKHPEQRIQIRLLQVID